MSYARQVKPGYVITYPNRGKSSSRRAQLLVVAVLAISALLMLAVTVGGWSKLDGLMPVNLAWCLAYLVIARYVLRWAHGLLPIATALGALMLTFAVIAATSLDGLAWSARNHSYYAPTHTLFGGAGLHPGLLSALTIAIAASQALLIVVSLYGFGQGWNIEYEVPAEQVAAA